MAVLNGERDTGPGSLIGGVLLILVSGCVLIESLDLRAPGETEERSFSHRLHAEIGMTCDECHTSDDEPIWPDAELCQFCHEDIDYDKPEDQRAAALFDSGPLAGEELPALYSDEIIFDHASHVNRGVSCEDCHGDVEHSDSVDGTGRWLSMDACMNCHEVRAEPHQNACSVCHAEIRMDVAPGSHHQQWMRMHGQVVRGGSEMRVDDCSMCHTQATCVTCHQDEPPANHNSVFRLRTHGVIAAIDRENCTVCHKADSCTACHEEVLPMNHRGMFGSPKDTHCYGCHFPLKDNGCFVCHKGTPSHNQADPLPPDHSPAFDCRQCHGVDVPLKHVDGGQDCLICHK